MTEKKREKEVPEYKIDTVKALVKKMKESKTILVASTRKLPSSQFHEIKKKLRGIAEIAIAKKSLVLRAIDASGKASLQDMKSLIVSDVALFFSDRDAFELSGILGENQSATKAKAGDIPSEDIVVEPGPTELVPGPAISELSAAGLKVAVEGGKLAVKIKTTIAKAGEPIKENVASVMGKLNILPMKVGFEPVAAYDSVSDKVYRGIKINKAEVLDQLKDCIKRAMGFAVGINYMTKETVSYFIKKAGLQELALEKKLNIQGG